MSTAHEYRYPTAEPTDPELGHVIDALCSVFQESRKKAAVWIITDADCRIMARVDAANSLVRGAKAAQREHAAECMLDGHNAFRSCLSSGALSRVIGREHDREELRGCVTLAMPVSSSTRLVAGIGCVLPVSESKGENLDLLASFLRAAAEACEQGLRARQAEQRLALIRQGVENAAPAEARLIVAADLRIVHVSRAALNMLHGVESSLIGQDVSTFCSPALAKTLQALSGGRSGKPCRTQAAGTFTYGTDTRPITLSMTPLAEPGHEPRVQGWLIHLDDRTQNARPEERADRGNAGTRYAFEDIVCADAGHIQQLHFARRMANSSSSILITGESGTGKELYAQAIHGESPFAAGPFVPLNCACLPRDLIEAELFGYQDGAFTGAKKGGNPGKILLAHQGTLFLDEIGDMPLDLQSKLLRVLQERTFLPVGGTRYMPVTFRLIAATNQDLAELVSKNQFRSDLYYRINVVHIQLMSLRDRPGDILPLAHHFLGIYSSRRGIRAEGFAPEARDRLLRHAWPGNVRELENAVEFACNLLDGPLVEARHLPSNLALAPLVPEVILERTAQTFTVVSAPDPAAQLLTDKITSYASMNMEEYSLQLILRAMNQCGGNIAEAAQLLSIGRSTLYRKLKKFQLKKRFRMVASDYVSPELLAALSDFCAEQIHTPRRYVRPDEYSAEVSRYAWIIAQNELIRQFVRDLQPGVVHGPKELVRVLRGIPERDTKVASVYIAVEKTNRVYGPMIPLYPKGYDVAGRVWYREATQRKSLIFTNPYLCPLTGEYVLTTAAPILEDDGSTIAVVGVDVLVHERKG